MPLTKEDIRNVRTKVIVIDENYDRSFGRELARAGLKSDLMSADIRAVLTEFRDNILENVKTIEAMTDVRVELISLERERPSAGFSGRREPVVRIEATDERGNRLTPEQGDPPAGQFQSTKKAPDECYKAEYADPFNLTAD